ncbi:MAG: NADH-quinone oxidoreductase subunit NuoK [Dehalococcoidia bacterium]|nr:NADH-quinone oxidoreductase subunit NuoK [Dehalococcoidia bacterium]|tara:strand:- start:206 stop:550 length:345 start_codon:yes stop_codon:yes gene_type:complete
MTLEIILIFSSALLSIGIFGLLTRKNIVITLMSLELIFNSVVLSVVAFNRYSLSSSVFNEITVDNFFGILSGNILGIFIICVAAGETALALAMVLALGKFKSTVELSDLSEMKN